MVVLDFETRSRCDLRTSGEWAYSRHPSTEVLSLAYKIGQAPTRIWQPLPDDPLSYMPLDLMQALLRGDQFEAHNYFFEFSIWENVLHKRRAWPALHIHRLTCTAARAAAQGLPRKLEKVAEVLHLPLQKDMAGHRTMLAATRPKKDGSFESDPEKIAQVLEYNIRDVEVEALLGQRLKPLSPSELKVFELDQKMAARGLPMDRLLIQKLQDTAEMFLEMNKEKISELTEGEITSPMQVAKIMAWVAQRGVPLENLSAGTIKVKLTSTKIPPNVRAVLECRRNAAKSSTKKLKSMLAAMDPDDDRIRGVLVYHGAHTGRYSGKLIQPQNFPRGTLKKDQVAQAIRDALGLPPSLLLEEWGDQTLDVIASLLRSTIKAPKEHKLMAADFSAIEPRVLFWLAGEAVGLNVFKAGEDIYVEIAAQYYGVKKKDVTPEQRQFGKVIIIACGYGMGAAKFKDTAATYGIKITDQEASKAVYFYRERFSKVPEFWKALERAFIAAVDSPGRLCSVGLLKFQYKPERKALLVKLPSGRIMTYNAPGVEMVDGNFGPQPRAMYWGVDSKTKKWSKISTYSGRLAENLVQAVSRDFMVDAMLRVEDAGFPVILTVHDEVVSLPTVEKDLNKFADLMALPPAWGKGCPVKVEAWEGGRYKK